MCVAYTKKASKQDCLRLCDKLRSKISHNRRYSYDDMQIPKEYISKLEELYNKILPDELDKYKYLFNGVLIFCRQFHMIKKLLIIIKKQNIYLIYEKKL